MYNKRGEKRRKPTDNRVIVNPGKIHYDGHSIEHDDSTSKWILNGDTVGSLSQLSMDLHDLTRDSEFNQTTYKIGLFLQENGFSFSTPFPPDKDVADEPEKQSPKNTEWTDEELQAAVISYFEMLEKENTGEPYSKAEANRQLREKALPTRSKQSIEYRMANISSVLSELCHPTIDGYKPRGNIGAEVKSRIINILTKNNFLSPDDNTPTPDDSELDQKVSRLLKRGVSGKPKGSVKPKSNSSTRNTYYRDPLVKAWIIDNAKGQCELCGKQGPFLDQNTGYSFLEVHHIIPLADEGADTIENTAGLCPNCHRECHLGEDTERLRHQLFSNIIR